MHRLVLVAVVLVLALVRCGRDSTQGPASPVGDPAKAKFSWIVQNVLTPQCGGCHNSTHPVAKVDMSTYAGATDGLIVVAGKPEASSLYAQVASGKMPKKGNRLPDDQIQAIYDWIKAGALND